MGKKHPYYEKSISTDFQSSPHLPVLWETHGETHAFPTWWDISHNGNWIKKKTHTLGKVLFLISQVLPIKWVSLHFPILCDVDGKSHAFLIWWDLLTYFHTIPNTNENVVNFFQFNFLLMFCLGFPMKIGLNNQRYETEIFKRRRLWVWHHRLSDFILFSWIV